MQAAAEHFPEVTGSTLEHRRVTVPRDLSGERNIIVLSFRRESESQLQSWLPTLEKIEASDGGTRYFILEPVFHSNFVTRWWYDSALRMFTRDRSERQHVVPIYVDRQQFFSSLNLTPEKARGLLLLVVNRSGDVLMEQTGAYSDASGRVLQAAAKRPKAPVAAR